MQTWQIDASQILTRRELAAVLANLKRCADRLANVRQNLARVRLACCCGLRASEISGLRLGYVNVEISRPYLRIRAETAKGGRPRRVPLWWDTGTLEDLAAWKTTRRSQGARSADSFLCSLQAATFGEPINRHVLRRRFHTACCVLGLDRLRTLTLHHGRHAGGFVCICQVVQWSANERPPTWGTRIGIHIKWCVNADTKHTPGYTLKQRIR